MKKHLLITTGLLFAGAAGAQQLLISENFDGYTAGALIAQTAGLPWSTWSESPGTGEDSPVSDEQAYSGTNSLKVSGVTGGGPTDLILRLGNRTSGNYALSWFMYIPTGFGGYFNLQHNEVPGAGSWLVDVTYAPGGATTYAAGAITGSGTFPHDEWFNVAMSINLGTSTGIIAINGIPEYTWQTTTPGPSQLGGVDFFAYAGGAGAVPTYYVDDVNFLDLTGLSVAENASAALLAYPNPTEGPLTLNWGPSTESTEVSVFDITGRPVLGMSAANGRNASGQMNLDLSGLPDGAYFVRIKDGDREVVQRVAKH